VANIGPIFVNRSRTRVIVDMRFAECGALQDGRALLLGLVLYVPYLRGLFHSRSASNGPVLVLGRGWSASLLGFKARHWRKPLPVT
jgi:hypothetical protein